MCVRKSTITTDLYIIRETDSHSCLCMCLCVFVQGKALGGALGGFTTARQEVVDMLRQR